jgi:hypothetical protein
MVDRDSRALTPAQQGAHTLRPCLIARSPAPRRKVPMPRTPPFGRASRTSPSSARSKRTTSAHSIQTPFPPDRSTSFWWRGPPQLGAPRRRDPNLSARLFHDVEAGRHSPPSNSTVRRRVRTRAPEPVTSSRRRARRGSSSRQSPRSTPTSKTILSRYDAIGESDRMTFIAWSKFGSAGCPAGALRRVRGNVQTPGLRKPD